MDDRSARKAGSMSFTLSDHRQAVRDKILSLLQTHVDGLTPTEVADLLDEDILCVRPPITNLTHEGLLEKTSQTRKSALGQPTRVWRIVTKSPLSEGTEND